MRILCSRTALLLLFSLVFKLSYADGTKQVMPSSTSGVGYLIAPTASSGSYRGAPAENRIRFYINNATTERLYFGLVAYDRSTTPQEISVWYRILRADGTVVTGPTQTSTSGLAAGHPNSYSQAATGPIVNLTNALSGYRPITFTPTVSGEYYLEVYKSADNGATASTDISLLTWFDFTVATASGTYLPGRVYSRGWSFITYNTSDNSTDATKSLAADFYGYTEDSTVSKVTFNSGFKPLGFTLFLNKTGPDSTANFVNDRKSISSGSTSPVLKGLYPVFMTVPDNTLFPRSVAPSAPIVNKVYGCSSTGYFVSYTTSAPGDVAILLDLDGTTGYTAGTADRYLFAYNVPAGKNLIAWDGKNGLGNAVSSATATISLYLRRGRTNLPIYDAELNQNGLTVSGYEPVAYSPKLFWDDASLTNVGTSCITTSGTTNSNNNNLTGAGIDNSIVGQSSPGHAWDGPGAGLAVPAPTGGGGSSTVYTDKICDDYGNVRTINTWFYTNEIPSATNSFVLPNCDQDGDDFANTSDIDDDNDGIPDLVENGGLDATGDVDNDGTPNYLDADFCALNALGVCSSMDADGDGIINSLDLDSDNDGISDLVEAGGVDTDGNGTVDYTGTWASNDTDNDGLLDRYDATENNPNVVGVAIRNLDTDGDGIPNFKDLDSDNDGIPDIAEVGGVDANGDGRIDNFVDTDGDGFADTVDGLVGTTASAAKALVLTGTYTSTSSPIPVNYIQGLANTDGRGLPNPYDLDSDDDGIPDIIEAGGTDANYDGKVDYTGTFAANDTDGDGFINSVDGDADNDGVAENTANALLATGTDVNNDGKADSYLKADNADGTGPANPYDLDSDDDGIPDLIESGGVDSNGGGRADLTTDVNGNGWVDTYDPTITGGINIRLLDVNGSAVAGGLVFDFDGDGIPNYLDLDSDNDGIPDIVEQGGADINNDGKVDVYADVDNDGFADIYDGRNNSLNVALGTPIITSSTISTNNLPASYSTGDNMDNNGLMNMLDLDADGDGILDTRESGIGLDTNNDGVINSNDTGFADANGDGWADNVDNLNILPLVNTTASGNPNYLDVDSDDDGIPDNIEGQTTAAYLAPLGTDTDGDGIDDRYDNVNTGGTFGGNTNNGIVPVDTDADGLADYRDLDSDADGKPDRLEGWDTNGNGVINGSEKAYVGTTDTDGDGLLDEYDVVTSSTANYITNVTNSTTPTSYPDVNNPGGDRDWRQTLDTDKDGVPDITDIDDDNDGIPDAIECPTCTTKVFQNGSFELPVQANGITYSTAVPGWGTTASDNTIEIWKNIGAAAAAGSQYVELNANFASTLYQNFCLNGNGATILWSVKHRGRAGVDVASVGFGSSATTLTVVATMTDGTSAWGAYNGSYTVPAGVTNLFFGLTAVSTSTGNVTIGNFIDDVQITIINQPCDTDGDGIPDSKDLDSDGDGIPDLVEAGGIDADGNGTVDYVGLWIVNDTNGDGLINTYDATATGGVAIANLDTDGDGIPNAKDLDSDNDGIADVTEAGGTDANYDGKLDNTTDADNDGLSDLVDGDVGNDGVAENTAGALIITSATGTSGRPTSYPRANADANGLPNPYDLDSDDDGIPDLIEVGGIDSNGDGRIDATTDANGNGWRDFYDPTATGGINLRTIDANGATAGGLVFDFDGDGIANYLDLDSDNDGIPDIVEQGGADTNNNGKVDGTADVDGDGFIDTFDPINNSTAAALGTAIITTGSTLNTFNYPTTYSTGDNKDGMGLINMLDLDADGDGITDVKEAGFTESTTTLGFAAGTIGTNGWSTTVSGSTTGTLALPNTDTRGPANYLDIDADDDGITDNVEGQATYSYKLPLGTDVDADGIDDAYDATTTVGGAGIVPVNTGGAADPDYTDIDSDGDNVTDLRESVGNPLYTLSSTVDTDGDGLLDVFDTFNMTTQTTTMQNNVTMTNMGANGITAGPTGAGSNARIYKTSTIPTADRDWRNVVIILPVKLISFTGSYSNKVSSISWTTANETAHERYVVERSTDGTNFTALTAVAARGNSGNYTYSDNAVPAVNIVYYRLQMVDESGNVTYSKVIAIKLNGDKMNLSIYPNPVVDVVTVSFASTTTQAVTIKVYNMQGAQVITRAYKAQAGTNTLQLTDWNMLPTGDYLIEVGNETFRLTHKLSHVH